MSIIERAVQSLRNYLVIRRLSDNLTVVKLLEHPLVLGSDRLEEHSSIARKLLNQPKAFQQIQDMGLKVPLSEYLIHHAVTCRRIHQNRPVKSFQSRLPARPT